MRQTYCNVPFTIDIPDSSTCLHFSLQTLSSTAVHSDHIAKVSLESIKIPFNICNRLADLPSRFLWSHDHRRSHTLEPNSTKHLATDRRHIVAVSPILGNLNRDALLVDDKGHDRFFARAVYKPASTAIERRQPVCDYNLLPHLCNYILLFRS